MSEINKVNSDTIERKIDVPEFIRAHKAQGSLMRYFKPW